MAKITKGRDFGGAVRYVTQDKKEAKILDSKGVLTTDKQSIINSFRLQCQLRPDVKVMVGHISLDFSVEDVDKMSDDFMVKIAQEYMQRMNILNTQFIIARHYDREHPHCHIIINRIGNNGKMISDRNDRVRSAKICRSLTEKYHLHLANGKDHVHRDRLRGADAVKYRIMMLWKQLFQDVGIGMNCARPLRNRVLQSLSPAGERQQPFKVLSLKRKDSVSMVPRLIVSTAIP